MYLRKRTPLKHPSSGSNNLVLASDGSVTTTLASASQLAILNSQGRFREYKTMYYNAYQDAQTSGTTTYNISGPASGSGTDGTNYVTVTPEATSDIIEVSWSFNVFGVDGYFGAGVQRATNSAFSSNLTLHYHDGEHAYGQFGTANDNNDYIRVVETQWLPCTSLTPDTTYYFRICIRTHSGTHDIRVGANMTANVLGGGVRATFKRWSTA
jgi:hypothetical protein